MEIISHRGFWKDISEKNSHIAFKRSFELNIGTETDIRDYKGKLVISHDLPNKESITFTDFLSIYNETKCDSTLALNIKSDGLQTELKKTLQTFDINNYFAFDMSIPDAIMYLKYNLNTFFRFSEYEFENPLWKMCDGIWYDSFTDMKLDLKIINKLISTNHKICIVSSELHKRDQRDQWNTITMLDQEIFNSNNLLLCTDLPIDAMEFFYDQ